MVKTVPCPRWIKTGETKRYESEDFVYPRSVSTREKYDTMPEHVGESYDACAGDVPVAPKGFGACPECGCQDWTQGEISAMNVSLEADDAPR